MRHTLPGLLCVLLLLLAAPLHAKPDGADDAPKKGKETEREWSTHEDLTHGFKLRYPADWEVRKGSSEFVVVTIVSGTPAEGHSADVVSVSCVEEKKKNLNLDAHVEAAIKQASESLKDFKLIERGQAQLDGHAGRKVVFTGKSDNGVEVESTTIFTLLEDGRFFSITLVSDPDRHDDFKPIMIELLESFKTFEPK